MIADNHKIFYNSQHIFEQLQRKGFVTKPADMIIYPSTRNDEVQYNLAIKPEFVDKYMDLLCVFPVQSQGGNFQGRYIGICEKDEILWFESYVDYNDVSFSYVSGNISIWEEIKTEMLQTDLKIYFLETLHKNGFLQTELNISPNNFDKKHLIKKTKQRIIRDIAQTKEKIVFDITYQNKLRLVQNPNTIF